MFNINDVKLGDYVENRDGDVGYVVDLKVKCMNFTTREYDVLPFKWCIANTKKYKVMTPKMESNPENYFKQIGTYVFDDDKIESLTPNITEIYASTYGGNQKIAKYTSLPDDEQIVDKINEIIKWINERGMIICQQDIQQKFIMEKK